MPSVVAAGGGCAGGRRREYGEDEDEEEEEDDSDSNPYASLVCSDLSDEEEEDEQLCFPTTDQEASADMPSAKYHALQKRLQVQDQKLGRSMHDGDDEGRPPASKRTKKAAAAAAAAGGGEEDECNGSPQQQQRRNPRKCWLCTFANCKMAKQVSVFVAANAGTMDPAIMAEQIRREVLREYPRAKGAGRRHVLRHIREHVLIPGVRLAGIVRSLITLAETLRCTLQQVDEETGDLVVDIRNTELYLKVITQITNVYKLDSSKLLFQNGLAPAAAASTVAAAAAAAAHHPPHGSSSSRGIGRSNAAASSATT